MENKKCKTCNTNVIDINKYGLCDICFANDRECPTCKKYLPWDEFYGASPLRVKKGYQHGTIERKNCINCRYDKNRVRKYNKEHKKELDDYRNFKKKQKEAEKKYKEFLKK